MYGRRASQLLKELDACEPGQLVVFNNDVFDQVIRECNEHNAQFHSLIRKVVEQNLDIDKRNEDHYGATIHHLSLLRNKRCLMAYMYNRAETIQSFRWKIGPVLPHEIQEKLHFLEKEYFKNHSTAIKSYISEMDIDLTVDMVPPRKLLARSGGAVPAKAQRSISSRLALCAGVNERHRSAGRGLGRARGRGRGRGRAARSPSLATPSSSSSDMQDEERPVLIEFVVVLKGDPHTIQRLPDAFADFVFGNGRPGSLHLREDDYGCYPWIVDVIYDARGKMYLHIGWERFARYHHLQAGFVLVFSYFGDRDMSVKVFDETHCRRHYRGDSAEEEDD